MNKILLLAWLAFFSGTLKAQVLSLTDDVNNDAPFGLNIEQVDLVRPTVSGSGAVVRYDRATKSLFTVESLDSIASLACDRLIKISTRELSGGVYRSVFLLLPVDKILDVRRNTAGRAVLRTLYTGTIECDSSYAVIQNLLNNCLGGSGGTTDLSITRSNVAVSIASNTGTDVTITAAQVSPDLAGVMTAADKKTLDSLNLSGTNGQVLTYQSGKWSAANPTGGSISGLDFVYDTITQTAHGFRVGDAVLDTGALATPKYIKGNTSAANLLPSHLVVDSLTANSFVIQRGGYAPNRSKFLSRGFAVGSIYYLQDNGSLGTTPDSSYNWPIFAITTQNVPVYIGTSWSSGVVIGDKGDIDVVGESDWRIDTGAVTTSRINDGAVTAAKLNQMSATSGQVLKWNGSAWVPSADNGTGGTTISGISGQELTSNTTLDTFFSTRKYQYEVLHKDSIASLPVQVGDVIYVNSTKALYIVEADSVAGFATDSIAVIPVNGLFAKIDCQPGFDPKKFGINPSGSQEHTHSFRSLFNYQKHRYGRIDIGIAKFDTFNIHYLNVDTVHSFAISGSGVIALPPKAYTGYDSLTIFFLKQIEQVSIKGVSFLGNKNATGYSFVNRFPNNNYLIKNHLIHATFVSTETNSFAEQRPTKGTFQISGVYFGEHVAKFLRVTSGQFLPNKAGYTNVNLENITAKKVAGFFDFRGQAGELNIKDCYIEADTNSLYLKKDFDAESINCIGLSDEVTNYNPITEVFIENVSMAYGWHNISLQNMRNVTIKNINSSYFGLFDIGRDTLVSSGQVCEDGGFDVYPGGYVIKVDNARFNQNRKLKIDGFFQNAPSDYDLAGSFDLVETDYNTIITNFKISSVFYIGREDQSATLFPYQVKIANGFFVSKEGVLYNPSLPKGTVIENVDFVFFIPDSSGYPTKPWNYTGVLVGELLLSDSTLLTNCNFYTHSVQLNGKYIKSINNNYYGNSYAYINVGSSAVNEIYLLNNKGTLRLFNPSLNTVVFGKKIEIMDCDFTVLNWNVTNPLSAGQVNAIIASPGISVSNSIFRDNTGYSADYDSKLYVGRKASIGTEGAWPVFNSSILTNIAFHDQFQLLIPKDVVSTYTLDTAIIWGGRFKITDYTGALTESNRIQFVDKGGRPFYANGQAVDTFIVDYPFADIELEGVDGKYWVATTKAPDFDTLGKQLIYSNTNNLNTVSSFNGGVITADGRRLMVVAGGGTRGVNIRPTLSDGRYVLSFKIETTGTAVQVYEKFSTTAYVEGANGATGITTGTFNLPFTKATGTKDNITFVLPSADTFYLSNIKIYKQKNVEVAGVIVQKTYGVPENQFYSLSSLATNSQGPSLLFGSRLSGGINDYAEIRSYYTGTGADRSGGLNFVSRVGGAEDGVFFQKERAYFGFVGVPSFNNRQFVINSVIGANDWFEVRDSGLVRVYSEFAVGLDSSLYHNSSTDITSLKGNVILKGTGYIKLQSGTTAQRPVTEALWEGGIRYNDQTKRFEGSDSITVNSFAYTSDIVPQNLTLTGTTNNLALSTLGGSGINITQDSALGVRVRNSPSGTLALALTPGTTDKQTWVWSQASGIWTSTLQTNGASVSTTTDANGDVVISHGLLLAPSAVSVTFTGTALGTARFFTVHTKTSTEFSVRFYDSSGTVLGSGVAVNFDWLARL